MTKQLMTALQAVFVQCESQSRDAQNHIQYVDGALIDTAQHLFEKEVRRHGKVQYCRPRARTKKPDGV